MTNKQLKDLIVKKAEKTAIPDCKDGILRSAHHQVNVDVESFGDTMAIKNRANLIYSLAAIALVAIITIMFIASNLFPGNNGITLTKAEKVFSNEVFAVGNLISGDGETSGLSVQNSQSSEDNQDTAQKINQFMFMGEAFANQDSMTAVYEKNTNDNYAEYAYKMTVSYKDGRNYEESYACYYNQTQDGMEGVIVYFGHQIDFTCEQQVNGEQVEMKLTVYTSAFTKIEVLHSADTGAYTYKYSLAGDVRTTVNIDTSAKNGKKTSNISITYHGIVDTTIACAFTYESKTISCLYSINVGDILGGELNITIYIRENKYVYDFGMVGDIDGAVISLPKHTNSGISA